MRFPDDVDGGRPVDELEAGQDLDDTPRHPPHEPAPEVPDALDVDLGWTAEGMGSVLAGFGMLANGLHRIRGAGPEDAWLLTEDDRLTIGEPLARYANRNLRLRALAAQGDLTAAAIGLVAYGTREAGRAAAWRDLHADELADLDEEQRVAGDATVRPAPPGVRPTRPGAGFEHLAGEEPREP